MGIPTTQQSEHTMTVLTDLQATWTEKEQAEDAFAARAALEDVSNNLNEAHLRVQAIVDSGNFDTLPSSLKQALDRWWTIIKTARTSIGSDAEIMDILNWRP